MKRNCKTCKKPILKVHRWKQTHHRFLFWTWKTFAHRDCNHPTEAPLVVKRLKGEVPLPFPDDGLPAELNLGGDVYPTYGGIRRGGIDVEKFTA